MIETIDPARVAEALGDVLHACVLGGAGVSFVLLHGTVPEFPLRASREALVAATFYSKRL